MSSTELPGRKNKWKTRVNARLRAQLHSAFIVSFSGERPRKRRAPPLQFSILLALLFLCLVAKGRAQYAFSTNKGVAVINRYTGADGVIAVPQVLDGLPVVSLADFAFYSCTNVVSVTIPEGVTNIGFECFFLCAGLTNLALPGSVARIGDWAFQGCTNLSAIAVDPTNPVYSSVEGVIFDRNQTRLLAFPGGKSGKYDIPSTVAEVGVGAFSGCIQVTNINIPDKTMNLAESAFYGCSALTRVDIPAGVQNIGRSAFYSCRSLVEISIGNGVTNVGDYAFASCDHLSWAALGSAVTRIGYGAFSSTALSSLAIPDTVNTLGDGAFEYCTNLAQVTIGKGLGSLADFSFDGCFNLTDVRLPPGMGSIGIDAFGRCRSLTTITIPANVTNIGTAAFSGCTRLSSLCFLGDAPSVSGPPFVGDNYAIIYYLPQNSGWTSAFNGLPTVPWTAHIESDKKTFAVATNRFGFEISGAPNQIVVVEACTNLEASKWLPLQTNTLVSGSVYFSDPESTNFSFRLYRLKSR